MNHTFLKFFFLTFFVFSSIGLFAQPQIGELQNNALSYSSIPVYEGSPVSKASSTKPWREVYFVDINNQPPVETQGDQQCQLMDRCTGEAILNNEIILKQGEQLMVTCPDRSYGFDYCMNDDRLNDSPRLHQYHYMGEEQTPDFLSKQGILWGYGWNLWEKVSAHGPYFLLTAVKTGSATVSIFYGQSKPLAYVGALYKADTLLGHLTITVEE